MPRPHAATDRTAAADGHRHALVDHGREQLGQLGEVHRVVAVDHGHVLGRGGEHSGVDGGAVAGRGARRPPLLRAGGPRPRCRRWSRCRRRSGWKPSGTSASTSGSAAASSRHGMTTSQAASALHAFDGMGTSSVSTTETGNEPVTSWLRARTRGTAARLRGGHAGAAVDSADGWHLRLGWAWRWSSSRWSSRSCGTATYACTGHRCTPTGVRGSNPRLAVVVAVGLALWVAMPIVIDRMTWAATVGISTIASWIWVMVLALYDGR